jgi:hypothetical protein
MNFDGWHSWVDVSCIVTLAVIHNEMNRCLSSFINTVEIAFTDAVMMWFTLTSLFFWNVAPHIIGWLVPDFKKENHREFYMNFSTLEDEIIVLSQNVGHQSPNEMATYRRRTDTSQHCHKNQKIRRIYVIFVHNCVNALLTELRSCLEVGHFCIELWTCLALLQACKWGSP